MPADVQIIVASIAETILRTTESKKKASNMILPAHLLALNEPFIRIASSLPQNRHSHPVAYNAHLGGSHFRLETARRGA